MAADFSETMLQQARSYFREDGTLGGSTPIALLRADVARLPFATGSLAAIHAGGDTRRCATIEKRGYWRIAGWCVCYWAVGLYLYSVSPAGAAIHCWPNPQAALAEISRVLRPGGVFVASTFMVASAPLGQAIGNDALVRPLNQVIGCLEGAFLVGRL